MDGNPTIPLACPFLLFPSPPPWPPFRMSMIGFSESQKRFAQTVMDDRDNDDAAWNTCSDGDDGEDAAPCSKAYHHRSQGGPTVPATCSKFLVLCLLKAGPVSALAFGDVDGQRWWTPYTNYLVGLHASRAEWITLPWTSFHFAGCPRFGHASPMYTGDAILESMRALYQSSKASAGKEKGARENVRACVARCEMSISIYTSTSTYALPHSNRISLANF